MKKLKLNSKKVVMNANRDLVLPQVGKDIKIRAFSITQKEEDQLNILRKRYRVSRSAILRILLDNIEQK